MAAFDKYLQEQNGRPIDPETLRGVITDDINQAEELEASRAQGRANRHYNDKFIPQFPNRELYEEEHPHKE